jgi:hypothetical protein
MDPYGSKNLKRYNSLIVPFSEIDLKKAKIFTKNDPSIRKTKIICTIGYIKI